MEHRLQFYDDRQTHSLPRDKEKLEVLGPPNSRAGDRRRPDGKALLELIETATEEVREIYERVIHAQQPIYYGIGTADGERRAEAGGRRETATARNKLAAPPAAALLRRIADGKQHCSISRPDRAALALEVRKRQLKSGLAPFETSSGAHLFAAGPAGRC